jgi:hypothetical protein
VDETTDNRPRCDGFQLPAFAQCFPLQRPTDFGHTQIILTQEEAAVLRGALNSYVSDLRMEIADTDSWQFRQNLKREALLLKKLLEQLDAELASPAASL